MTFTKVFRNLSVPSAMLIGFVFAGPVNATTLGKSQDKSKDATEIRLIETAPGVQEWLKPEEREMLSLQAHDEGHCGGYIDVTNHPVADRTPVLPFSIFGKSKPDQEQTIRPLLEEVDVSNLNETIDSLAAFHNRFYKSETGVQSMDHVYQQFFMASAGRSDIEIERVKHDFIQPSIIARIKGSGANANEIVVVGGHGDSIGTNFGNKVAAVAPGADDNASGVAVVLEAYRIIAQSGIRPNRTIEFMIYAGEEAGLLGSLDIATQYKKAKKLVSGVIQFDMTMFTPDSSQIGVVTDHTDSSMTEFLREIIRTYTTASIVDFECTYGCSDHASWDRNGYSVAYPFEAAFETHNKKIHTAQDKKDFIDVTFGSNFAKLAIAFALELAL